MLTIPITLAVALILGFLGLRHAVLKDRSVMFLILLGACAFQTLVISLTQHYGLVQLAVVQMITAAVIPPLAWLTFQSAVLRSLNLKSDIFHVFGPLIIVCCAVFVPIALDIILSTLFATYGLSILIRLQRGDTLPLARLDAGPLPARIWKMVGALLVLSALSDILIAVAVGLGHVSIRPLIISTFSSFSLLGIGLLSLSRDAEGTIEKTAVQSGPQRYATVEDAALVARLDELMQIDRPYLDPDLTLKRLAHRLHVPIKQLSAAINLSKNENVSRYVNGFRIRYACQQLKEGSDVTEAMLSSGFNTKSNFNREFARIVGQSPSIYIKTNGNDD
ncbi:MAG: AraC family transcriptional regulator [Lentilitoribacter sp.]